MKNKTLNYLFPGKRYCRTCLITRQKSNLVVRQRVVQSALSQGITVKFFSETYNLFRTAFRKVSLIFLPKELPGCMFPNLSGCHWTPNKKFLPVLFFHSSPSIMPSPVFLGLSNVMKKAAFGANGGAFFRILGVPE